MYRLQKRLQHSSRRNIQSSNLRGSQSQSRPRYLPVVPDYEARLIEKVWPIYLPRKSLLHRE